MNKKHFFAIGFLALLIAGCCTYDASNGTPAPVAVEEYVELVGFQPTNDAKFLQFLQAHNNPKYNPIYRIQEYKDGNPVGQVFGGLKDIECEIEAKIDYLAKNPSAGKTSSGGVTKYGGQIGMSCSTSCKTDIISSSREMADDFRAKFGPPFQGKTHHRGH